MPWAGAAGCCAVLTMWVMGSKHFTKRQVQAFGASDADWVDQRLAAKWQEACPRSARQGCRGLSGWAG